MNYLLPSLLVVPLVGAIVCAFLRSASAARAWALVVSLATLAICVALMWQFNFSQDLSQVSPSLRPSQSFQINFGPNWDNVESPLAFTSLNTSFKLGVDSIALWLVALTVFLMPLAVAASFASIKDRAKEYYAWMLALLFAMLGVFVARDLLLFYIFFELTLIPMFFIIGIWGGPEKRRAAAKFFLFTFAGSVFTLAGVVYLGLRFGDFDIAYLTHQVQTGMTGVERFWILMAFLAGFAVKVPLFPVHTWLPLAHTEAPTAGSVILAGVLLKLGTYGLLRLALPFGLVGLEHSTEVVARIPFIWDITYPAFLKFLGWLCLAGIIYGALVAWVQQDIKKLVAYSSVSHLGFCVLGLVALNDIGLQGSVLYMINHGLSTGALFLVIGMIYDRYHTRDIDQLSGLARKMPKLAFFFVLFALSSIGLPALNGFVSEFLTILGAFTSDFLGIGFGVIAALGIILGAVYMLHMVARVVWGPLKHPGMEAGGHDHGHSHDSHGHASSSSHDSHGELPADLNAREVGILIPLAVSVILLGVMPNIILDTIKGPVQLIRTAPGTAVQADRSAEPAGALAATINVD